MKFSSRTTQLLKNFANINANLMFKSGNRISTLSASSTVYASCTIEEEIPLDFGVYNLNQLLQSLSLFDNPEVDFSQNFLTIKEGALSLKYTASPEDILCYPKKEITMPDAEINFQLGADKLQKLMSAARTLGVNDLSVVANGSTLNVMVSEISNPSSNKFDVTVGDDVRNFVANFSIDNMKLIAGDYDVSISSRGISKFQLIDNDLFYLLALEKNSDLAGV